MLAPPPAQASDPLWLPISRPPELWQQGGIPTFDIEMAWPEPLRALTMLANPRRAIQRETQVTTRAAGTFEVQLSPQALADSADGPARGRMSIDKQFQGDLTGSSKGEMLTAMTETKGSAGYVAIERVTGTLHGRRGSFVLQHSGTMTRGAPHLVITVVPDSGTDQLTGLSGTMTITIADGKHSYTFDYTLPASR